MVQFDDGCELHRFRHHLCGKESLSKIDVANSQGPRASTEQKTAHGGATLFRPLCQSAEANRIGPLRQLLPLQSPIEKIPRHGLSDFKLCLTGIIHFDLHGPGRMIRVPLNKLGREPKLSETMDCFKAQRVLAQAAGRDSVVTEQRADVGEVGWSATQLLSGGKHIPKQLA